MGQISQEGALRLPFRTYWRGVVSYFVAMHLRRLKRKSASQLNDDESGFDIVLKHYHPYPLIKESRQLYLNIRTLWVFTPSYSASTENLPDLPNRLESFRSQVFD